MRNYCILWMLDKEFWVSQNISTKHFLKLIFYLLIIYFNHVKVFCHGIVLNEVLTLKMSRFYF
jgi:hypothetical protein